MELRHFLLFIIILLIQFTLHTDELELLNGDIITGRIITMDDELVVIETEYGRLEIKRRFIQKGIFGEVGKESGKEKENEENEDTSTTDSTDNTTIQEGSEDTTNGGSPRKIPEQGLISELLFDSKFVDSASTQYSLSNKGSVQFTTGINGIEYHAIKSDGSGQYLVLSGQKEIDECTAFTISCWLLVKDWEKTQYILSKWTSTNGDKAKGKFALYTKQGFVLCYIVDTTGSYHHLFTEKPVKLNTWNHIVVTYDKGKTFIYINNTPRAYKEFDLPGLKKDSSPLYILTAKSATGNIFSYYNLSGNLDNLRIYNRPLTTEEVRSLFLEKKE